MTFGLQFLASLETVAVDGQKPVDETVVVTADVRAVVAAVVEAAAAVAADAAETAPSTSVAESAGTIVAGSGS